MFQSWALLPVRRTPDSKCWSSVKLSAHFVAGYSARGTGTTLQISLQIAADMKTIQELEGRFSQSVMAARQNHRFIIHLQLSRSGDHLFGEPQRKRSIVARINEQRLLLELGVALDIMRRTNHHPRIAQLLERNLGLQALPDMLRRQA